MEKLKNLSIKKTMVLYMIVNLAISYIISFIIFRAATFTQNLIWQRYVNEDRYFSAMQQENGDYLTTLPRISTNQMSMSDAFVSELCDFLQTYSVFFIACAGTIIMTFLFYRNKIKKPLAELNAASVQISKNNLEFNISYSNNDELGQLCTEFEKMRQQLIKNNKILWRTLEKNRTLYAAIAHDIRSPLTILKGYQEMLLEFVPENSIDKKKELEILEIEMQQISRMENFVDMMRKLSTLEERSLQYAEIDIRQFTEHLKNTSKIMAIDATKKCEIKLNSEKTNIIIDENMVIEVVWNLLSNGFRYAKKVVLILIDIKQDYLIITVTDDGTGFDKNIEIVTEAYYHSNIENDLQHSGLGLYISRLYCEKHGGRLLYDRQHKCGASIVASFRIQEKMD